MPIAPSRTSLVNAGAATWVVTNTRHPFISRRKRGVMGGAVIPCGRAATLNRFHAACYACNANEFLTTSCPYANRTPSITVCDPSGKRNRNASDPSGCTLAAHP